MSLDHFLRELLADLFSTHGETRQRLHHELIARLDETHRRLSKIELTLERMPEIMSGTVAQQLEDALAPLNAGVAQTAQDMQNVGTAVTAGFTAVQDKIAQLESQIANGGSVDISAQLAEINNDVSILASAHSSSQDILTNLGSLTAGSQTQPTNP